MVKVFFGCSMRGGHGPVSLAELAKFPDIIEELGHKVMSRHQTTPGIIDDENKLTTTAIHDRDYGWAVESDVGVFEISNPSLGTGGEISDLVHMGKPVLCLFKKIPGNSISAYIRGKQGSKYVSTAFECHAYETFDDAREIIRGFVEAQKLKNANQMDLSIKGKKSR